MGWVGRGRGRNWKVRERLVRVGYEGAERDEWRRGVDEWRASLCHRCDGQLQLERAPMHCRWSVQCFEWPENIPPSSICIERRNHCTVYNLEQLWGFTVQFSRTALMSHTIVGLNCTIQVRFLHPVQLKPGISKYIGFSVKQSITCSIKDFSSSTTLAN